MPSGVIIKDCEVFEWRPHMITFRYTKKSGGKDMKRIIFKRMPKGAESQLLYDPELEALYEEVHSYLVPKKFSDWVNKPHIK